MQMVPMQERVRMADAYEMVLIDLRAYRSALDYIILQLEWLQKTNNSAICSVDLSRAPGFKSLLENGLSATQNAALAELENLAGGRSYHQE